MATLPWAVSEQRLPRTVSTPSSTTQQQARMHRTRGWETHRLWSIFSFLETVSPSTYQVQKVHVVSTQTHSFTGFPNPCAPRWRNLGRRQPKSTLGQSSLSRIRVKPGALNGPTPPRGRHRRRHSMPTFPKASRAFLASTSLTPIQQS